MIFPTQAPSYFLLVVLLSAHSCCSSQRFTHLFFVEALLGLYPPDHFQEGSCSPRTIPCVWSSLHFLKTLCLRGDAHQEAPWCLMTAHPWCTQTLNVPGCREAWASSLHRAEPFSWHLCYSRTMEKLLQLKSVSLGWDQLHCGPSRSSESCLSTFSIVSKPQTLTFQFS